MLIHPYQPSIRQAPPSLHKTAVSQLFVRFQTRWGNRWSSQFEKARNPREAVEITAAAWAEDLAGMTSEDLQRGLLKSLDLMWPPPASEFRHLCLPDPAEYGLPAPDTAYREAIRNVGSVGESTWSHPAVQIAANEVGCWELRHLPEAKARPLFDRAYDIVSRRVMAGEPIEVPVPKALPPRTATTPEEQEWAARGEMVGLPAAPKDFESPDALRLYRLRVQTVERERQRGARHA